MKTLSYDRFGALDVLQMKDQPAPRPGKGEVQVAVKAASLNLIDVRVRSGMMGPLVSKKFPKTPGADFSGVVAAVGEGVSGVKVGDAVFGAADPFRGGAIADFVVVPEKQVAKKPAALSHEDAASLPIAGLAALLSIRDLGKTGKGSRVLVHGASGGVGLYAVAIAKNLGAHVTAVAGRGADAVREAGADVVLDYRKGEGADFAERFDVVLNASGKLPFAAGRRFLTPKGVLVEPSPTIPVFIGANLANLFRAQKHAILQTVPTRTGLETLLRLVDAGAIRTRIARVFPFAAAKDAFRALEDGGVVGKVVIAAA